MATTVMETTHGPIPLSLFHGYSDSYKDGDGASSVNAICIHSDSQFLCCQKPLVDLPPQCLQWWGLTHTNKDDGSTCVPCCGLLCSVTFWWVM